MKIAVCDDEKIFSNYLYQQIENQMKLLNCGLEFDFKRYQSGYELIEASRVEHFDAVFLDIDMPMLDGFETAKELYRILPDMILVFVTSKDDLVYESFRYHPFRYLRKDYLTEELPETTRKLVEHYFNNKMEYVYKFSGALVRIKMSKIIYFESQRNAVIIHTVDNTYRQIEKIGVIEKELKGGNFIRTHNGFIVNCAYIKKLDRLNVYLTTGAVLPLSRQKSAQVRDMFQKYMRF